ncbi:MAG TPA: hypothetical protein VGP33_06810 [Chloroflexota bacterium]|jgi:Zn finger protein HypA/HybF involved in hydrogenase expression|nr:hypothetical protein [Chloroflexota bacterium]
MRWLTSDRVRCLDCRQSGWIQSRWLSEGRVPYCPHCHSVAVQRHATRWSWLRDVIIISNGA